MTIDNDVKITINLSELVDIRCDFLDLDEEDITHYDRERIVNNLRTSLTWDTLYYMIDNVLLEEVGKAENHYGETVGDEPAKTFEQQRKNAAQFELVDLVAPAWTIQVPRRKDR